MCNCIAKLEKSLEGDIYGTRIIRSATFIEPRIRFSFTDASPRDSVTCQMPYCPFCGEAKSPQTKIVQASFWHSIAAALFF